MRTSASGVNVVSFTNHKSKFLMLLRYEIAFFCVIHKVNASVHKYDTCINLKYFYWTNTILAGKFHKSPHHRKILPTCKMEK